MFTLCLKYKAGLAMTLVSASSFVQLVMDGYIRPLIEICISVVLMVPETADKMADGVFALWLFACFVVVVFLFFFHCLHRLCCNADKLQKTNLNAAHSVASNQDGVAKNGAAADSD